MVTLSSFGVRHFSNLLLMNFPFKKQRIPDYGTIVPLVSQYMHFAVL